MNKTYAVFLFDDDKKGFERYTFLQDVETESPQETAINAFREYISPDKPVKTDEWGMKITINDIKFAGQVTAFTPMNGGKSIVLAERIK